MTEDKIHQAVINRTLNALQDPMGRQYFDIT